MSKHPNNGPTFSKPTTKKPRPAAPSPGREQAQLDQDMREAAKSRSTHQLINKVGIVEYMRLRKKP